jgi:proteasome lid subunit RPN8/RPN11
MNISRELLEQMVGHALEDPENEVCGVVAWRTDPAGADRPASADRVYRATNIHASPLRFEIHPDELLKLWNACQEDGCDLGAIYHSHVRSDPYPSQTDINFATKWPGVEWIIVGLAGKEPEVRCYSIEDGEVRDVPLQVR